MNHNIYPVVIFKIVDEISSRPNPQNINDLINSSKISAPLTSPYSKNQNNCYQGIFNSGSCLIKNLFTIRENLFPYKICFSIGIGSVTSDINPIMATDIQGSAINRAIAGLNRNIKSNSFLSMKGFTKSLDAILFPTITLLWGVSLNWNHNRIKILNLLLKNEPEQSISNNLNISTRAVYKNISAAKLNLWVTLINSVEESITRILENSLENNKK